MSICQDPHGYGAVVGTALPRERRTWDLVLGLALGVVALAAAVLLGLLGLFLVFVSDPCGSSVVCDGGRLTVGVVVATAGPGVVAVATLVLLAVRLLRRRLAWWVPAAGIVLEGGVWALGAALAFSAVGSA